MAAAPKSFVPDAPASFIPDTPTGLSSLNKNSDTPTPPPSAAPDDLSEFSSGLSHPESIHKITAAEAANVYQPLLKYGGMVAGAALAAPLAAASGGALAPAIEPAAGAAGFAIGASLSDQLDNLIGLTPEPKNTGDIANKTAENIREGVQSELLGRNTGAILEGAANATLTGASALATKGPEALQKISDTAAKFGINLTPAELVGSKALSGLENILDNVPWTAGIIQRYRLGEMQKLNNLRDQLISDNGSGEDIEQLGIKIKNMADNYIQKIGVGDKVAKTALKNRLLDKMGSDSSYEDLDISAKEAVQKYQQDLSGQVSSAYAAVSKKIPTGAALPENTISAADKILADQERLAPSVRNNDLIRAAKFFTEGEQVGPIPPEVMIAYKSGRLSSEEMMQIEKQYPGIDGSSLNKTYSDLAENVKAFNDKKFSETDFKNGAYKITNAGRQWDSLIDGANKDMDAIAASGGEDLQKAHQVAKDLYVKKMALFEDPAFKTINNKYPGAVATSVLQSGNPELVSRYKDLVGKDLFEKTKDRLTNDLLGLGKDEIVNGDSIRKNVVDLGASANVIYSPEELTYFKKLADAVDLGGSGVDNILKNPLLKKMTSNQAELVPSGIAKSIITPNNAGAASAIETMLGSGAKKKIADAFLPQLLSANQQGDFLPATFAKQFDTYGKNTIEAWYGKDFASKLEDLALVGNRMKKYESATTSSSGPRYLIGFYEGTRLLHKAFNAVASGLSTPAVMSFGNDATMILGSRQLAKIYASPLGRDLFVDGLITRSSSKEAGEIGAKIMSIIGNEVLKRKNQEGD